MSRIKEKKKLERKQPKPKNTQSEIEIPKGPVTVEVAPKSKIGKISWSPEPVLEQGAVGRFYLWRDKDDRFHVYRVDSPVHDKIEYGTEYRVINGKDGFVSYWSVESESRGPGHPKYYNSLDHALRVAEFWFQKTGGFTEISSNREAVVNQAVKADLAVGSARTNDCNEYADKPPKSGEGKAPRAARSKGEKDETGHRKGSQASMCAGAVGTEYKSVEAMAQEISLPVGRVKSHMRYMLERDRVEKKGNEYRLKRSDP